MGILFHRLYELRAGETRRISEEAGGAVVIVGPPCAGKTLFISEFLEDVKTEELTAGITPKEVERLEDQRGSRARRALEELVKGDYVPRGEFLGELKDVKGADLLTAFEKLPRRFVEFLKQSRGWGLYLFYIPPEAEEDREYVEKLREIAKRVGVKFEWLGLEYTPPRLAAVLKERGEQYVEEQLRLYKDILERLGIAEDRIRQLWERLKEAGKEALRSRLEQLIELAAGLEGVLSPAVSGLVLDVVLKLVFLMAFERRRGSSQLEWIETLTRLGKLEEPFRCLLLAHLALRLGVDREDVEKALDAATQHWQKLEEEVKKLRAEVGELWKEVEIAELQKFGDVYTRREAEELGVTYDKVIDVDGKYRLVTAGGFKEAAEEVKKLLTERRFVVVRGPRGIGKSTLAAYVAYDMLQNKKVDCVVAVERPIDLSKLLTFEDMRVLLLFDPHPRGVYLRFDPRRPYEELYTPIKESVETLLSLAALAEYSRGELYILAAAHDDLLREKVGEKAVEEDVGDFLYSLQLKNREFIKEVLKNYACPKRDCGLGQAVERLAELISEFDSYTLVAKYAGLWLRSHKTEDVEAALREAKRGSKLFFASYLWHVLLRGSGDLAKKAAAPLLLHAAYGPVPEGVAYLTKADKESGVWQFVPLKKLRGASLDSLREDELEPIAKWLSRHHEDLIEEMLRDLAGLNGEEKRTPYRGHFGKLINALEWALEEVQNEHASIHAAGEKSALRTSIEKALATFVYRRLIQIFNTRKVKRCWQRAAFITGRALAGELSVPRREDLPGDAAEALGDALEPCDVDNYLLVDGETPPLTRALVSLPYLGVGVVPLLAAFADVYDGGVVERLVERWRRRGRFYPVEAFYALGLAAIASFADVDQKAADTALHAASFAVQHVTKRDAIYIILRALRPLAKKAPDKYVKVSAAASGLEALPRGAVQFIYKMSRELRNRINRGGLWPLVEAVRIYSNLLITHWAHIENREEVVRTMCGLYSGVKSSAQRLGDAASDVFVTAARAYALSVALARHPLAEHVEEYCGVEDLETEAEEVRKKLDAQVVRSLARESGELRKWFETRSMAGDVAEVFEELRSWFTHKLAIYVLEHGADEERVDVSRLEKAAEYFREAAEVAVRRGDWRNYFVNRGRVLRTRVLGAESLGEFLERAEGFGDLWRGVEERFEPTAPYLEMVCRRLGEYLVYLAASRRGEEAEKLLKEWRPLLDYVPIVSVATRLMLKLFGVGEEVKPVETVRAYETRLSKEFLPALKTAYGLIDKSEAVDLCREFGEICVYAVRAVAGDGDAVERLKKRLKKELTKGLGKLSSEVVSLLEGADGKTLVEVSAPRSKSARLVFALLAALEGRAGAVMLHGLWGSVAFKEPLPRRLFRDVYEKCGSQSEGCRLVFLKLYYYHF